jgi:8-oxo-dGTP pyrophosphatase MutT (NUDIX family)
VPGIAEVLASYQPQGDLETADVARLGAVARGGDPWSRDRPLHATGSALVVHPPTRRVLLRWHTKMGRWLQVGGHGDPGEDDPWEIARREAAEESGLPDLAPLDPGPGRAPVHIVVVPVRASGAEPAHEHADLRYLLVTARPDATISESPGAPVRWVALDEVAAAVDDNLGESARRVAAHLSRYGS